MRYQGSPSGTGRSSPPEEDDCQTSRCCPRRLGRKTLNWTRFCRSFGATPRTALACFNFSSTASMDQYHLYFRLLKTACQPTHSGSLAQAISIGISGAPDQRRRWAERQTRPHRFAPIGRNRAQKLPSHLHVSATFKRMRYSRIPWTLLVPPMTFRRRTKA